MVEIRKKKQPTEAFKPDILGFFSKTELPRHSCTCVPWPHTWQTEG